ncbi:MAG: aminotransferase class I/II-fold pyridoxal phosphate-dependent enzyme [Candidatus Bathyarchaeota archaeon]|nr:aminotransferase class I/II-fold pyridoxal phosphate-dependent enzyme [Candidatus Bathyarchaeota archaeon]
MKIDPFRLERWLLEKAEIDLGGGGVAKLQLKDVVPQIPPDTAMRYGRTNGSDALRGLVADWYKVDSDNVLITSGTSEANLLVNLTLIESGVEYFTEVPQYEQTTAFARMLGAKVKPFHLIEAKGWTPDLKELKEKINRRTRIIFLDNPNNPTGAVMTQEEMQALCELAEDVGAYVHCDNALRGSEADGKPAATPEFYERGIITGSISKLGATSPRIGWIVAEKEIIERCWVMKDYTTLSHCGIGEKIAERLLANRARYVKRNMAIRQANVDTWNAWCKENPDLVTCTDPQGGFTVFPRYKNRLGSSKFSERLLKEEGVMVSPGDQFGVERHLRINIGTKGETLGKGLERMGRFMKRVVK